MVGWHGGRGSWKNLNLPDTPIPQLGSRSTWHFPALIFFLLVFISRHSQLCSCQERKQWNFNIGKTRPLLFGLDTYAQRASRSHLLPVRRCFQDNQARSSDNISLFGFPQQSHDFSAAQGIIYNRPFYLVNVSLLTEEFIINDQKGNSCLPWQKLIHLLCIIAVYS